MIGNGLQGTLLGVRGAIEGFSASTMAYVMSAYFGGFLAGSRVTPWLIRRVGHVRVFAALASLISAAFILYAALPHPVSWGLMRFLVGVCFAGVYVVSESWLNATTTNANRGQALSLYLIVQMGGIIMAQGLLNVADPGGYVLFVIMSVLVSISFAPILLSATPAPYFETTKPMTLRVLFQSSPLGMIGTFLLGGVFSAMFGMSAVFATEVGMTAAETSIFVAVMYAGGMLLQYPIGWLSDRMDRRILIFGTTGAAAGWGANWLTGWTARASCSRHCSAVRSTGYTRMTTRWRRPRHCASSAATFPSPPSTSWMCRCCSTSTA